ncbi:LacI family DNA-binding transcriptional regulator [Occultella gossypii]|uniref:LacI family DNA-binding transcriptional regulator n=1 Tax=Occultella gossypii TaxID=2800820 RepID=A0ABS7SHY3_9MICO|nr:LacI family DNA-binding transcriptional regulator [Occultella gossypii]MBZ2199390.1 LacI family DNA-binding transcriptional regulator [Occultella gossypii]
MAALAGVSQATVSFVLSGRTPSGVRISEETRKRVLDAIRITGYSANPVAQRLAGGHNQILGVFTYEATFPRGGRDFYGPFLAGIEHAAEQIGVDLLLFTSARVVEGSRKLTRSGWQRLGIADGCLLLGQHEERAELQHLLDTNYPFVFVGRRESEGGRLPFVGADYRSATRRAALRACSLGHRRIGYIGASTRDQPTLDRMSGYQAAMTESGLATQFVVPGDATQTAATIADLGLSAALLAPEVDPDELRLALSALRIRVPEDLSVLLLGQPHHQQPGPTRWSGFTLPREQMGARALHLLSQLVGTEAADDQQGTPDLHQLLECTDVPGETLTPPENADRHEAAVRSSTVPPQERNNA